MKRQLKIAILAATLLSSSALSASPASEPAPSALNATLGQVLALTQFCSDNEFEITRYMKIKYDAAIVYLYAQKIDYDRIEIERAKSKNMNLMNAALANHLVPEAKSACADLLPDVIETLKIYDTLGH
ncbi:hypothetical protein NVP1081O_261 [Vibrio phage 1.081.O._10N.286.52.C2]|nr:hypothetical protein NVP1081O_261 [Vibrio phage 1.081.O._10N.286.52.C2]